MEEMDFHRGKWTRELNSKVVGNGCNSIIIVLQNRVETELSYCRDMYACEC